MQGCLIFRSHDHGSGSISILAYLKYPLEKKRERETATHPGRERKRNKIRIAQEAIWAEKSNPTSKDHIQRQRKIHVQR